MHLLDIHEPGQTPAPHAEADVAVGIDLGTTYSLVAISTSETPEILRDPDGGALVPSVVAYLRDGFPIVGEVARRLLLDEPERVISSIKRLMGRGPEDVKAVAGTLPYAIDTENGEEGAMVRLKIGGHSLTPVEISAEILRTLKARAEHALGHNIAKAVVTVPAYFDDAARTATRDAAMLAGLEVLRLVNEPTAAALAYGLDNSAEGLYAIYDFGGGTFDISILRLEKGVFQVLATGGDSALGGDDLDHVIAERFLAERAAETGTPSPTVGEAKQVLITARMAKECLTESAEGTWALDIGGAMTRHSLDVAALESLIAPIVERTMVRCRQVLHDAELEASEISGVVLVGGSTRIPCVRRQVAELFGQEPLANIDPDEVVALGAALQAEALTRGSSTLLLDVTPLSLGIETMGGLVEKVIPRNTPIPVSRAQEFTTYQDGQTAMSILVVQGEREMSDQNRALARFVLNGIPPMSAGAARIRVTFAVDSDGLLTVRAAEDTTGVEQNVEVKPSYGLSDDELAGMLRDSMEHAVEDMDRRLLAEARVDGQSLLNALGGALEQDADLAGEDEAARLRSLMAELETAVEGDDRAVINGRREALDIASQDFAARRMDKGVGAALKGVAVDDLDASVHADGN